MPLDVPGEFFSEDSIKELLENLKNYQNRFKEIHKNLEKNKAEFKNYNYDELKKDIKELINDKKKLEEKITKMKNVSLNQGDEQVFKELLNVIIFLLLFNFSLVFTFIFFFLGYIIFKKGARTRGYDS